MFRRFALLAVVISLGCKESPKPEPAKAAAKEAPTKAPPPAAPPAPPPPVYTDPADPDEACARIISVAWAGAEGAPEDTTRDEAAAETEAKAIAAELAAPGSDFSKFARDRSDAKAKIRDGAIGTFTREKWPEKHTDIQDAVFALKVGQRSPVVKASYGFTIAERCKVEKVHTRHILIRYGGAHKAPEDLKRTKDEALALTRKVQDEVKGGGDFAKLATKYSEDGSKDDGGDLGVVGRGLFVPPYEKAAFALKPGEVSEPVETKYGFHLIERLE